MTEKQRKHAKRDATFINLIIQRLKETIGEDVKFSAEEIRDAAADVSFEMLKAEHFKNFLEKKLAALEKLGKKVDGIKEEKSDRKPGDIIKDILSSLNNDGENCKECDDTACPTHPSNNVKDEEKSIDDIIDEGLKAAKEKKNK